MSELLTSKTVTHELKCDRQFFEHVLDGSKPFEIRFNDRNYDVGHTLYLREWNPINETYTGREVRKRVTYITCWAQRKDFVVMGLAHETEARPIDPDHAELLKKIPRVSAEFVAEIRDISRWALERRVLIQKDWLGSYSQCLDGLDLRHIPGSGVESARDPRDIRRVVESLRPSEKTEREPCRHGDASGQCERCLDAL